MSSFLEPNYDYLKIFHSFEEWSEIVSKQDVTTKKLNDVDEILDFIYQYQQMIPLIIICGNSNRMIEIVENSLKSKSVMFSKPRFGIIRVEKL